MEKRIVIYSSKTGYTQKYAKWIAAALGCEAVAEQKNLQLSGYDVIVYGGSIMAGSISGIGLLKKHWEEISGKRIFVFATGLMSAENPEAGQMWEKNLPAQMRDKISCFYFRGGFDYNKLSWINKRLMSVMHRSLKKLSNPTAEQKEVLDAFETPADFTNQEAIAPLVKAVRETEKQA